MAIFKTTDNNGGKRLQAINQEYEETDFKAAVSDIKRISNKTLAELSTEENLLIFPTKLEDSPDLLKESKLGSLTKSDKEEDYIFSTENIAGFIGINDTDISITSRFAKNEEDFFLHYMIQKVLNLNITNLNFSSSQESVLNLLIYIFPRLLQKALSQGMYKEYKTFHKNDENVRGVIEISRHIQKNIPFEGKITYKTREYSYDNTTTELKTIKMATPFYNSGERQKIIAVAIKKQNHPYFTYYIPLKKLCIQILQNKKIKFARQKNRVYGILLDVSWLWEQYLAAILKQIGFFHPENRKGVGAISVLTNNIGRFIPDFYRDDFVLDAKYKPFDKRNPPSDDLTQVIAYMHIIKTMKGGYIYPSENENETILNELGEIKGMGGILYLCPFYIPQNCSTFSEFSEKIRKKMESKLRRWINSDEF